MMKKNVALRGTGRGTRLELTERNREGIAVRAQSTKGVVVCGLAIDGKSLGNSVAGVVFDDCGDCMLSEVSVKRFLEYGIWLRNNSFLCDIKSCKLADNQKAGVFLDTLANGGRVGDYVPNLVSGCIIYGGARGSNAGTPSSSTWWAVQSINPKSTEIPYSLGQQQRAWPKGTFVENNIVQMNPAYLGVPKWPDPLFEHKRLEVFIED